MSPYVLAAVFALGATTAGSAAWFVRDNIADAAEAKLAAAWDAERVVLAQAKATAETQNRELENNAATRQQELIDEAEQREAAIRSRLYAGYDSLRESYAASCRTASAVPDGAPSQGFGDGAADRDGHSGRIAKSLQRELAEPIDLQASNLIYLQDYIRSIPCINHKGETDDP